MGNEIKEIDIVILSFAQTEELKQVTIDCLNSLMAAEDPELIRFNIIIIESQKELKPFQYKYGQTIYPDQPFGYNRYMNIGIAMTSSPYVCLCNNDLLFHTGWATKMIKHFTNFPELSSASPICSVHHPGMMGIEVNSGLRMGNTIRVEVSGWCIFIRRTLFNLTGQLDENFIFKYASHDYMNTLDVLNINHILVTSSIVDHLDHKTLHGQSEERQNELTTDQAVYYKKKWNYRRGKNWKEL